MSTLFYTFLIYTHIQHIHHTVFLYQIDKLFSRATANCFRLQTLHNKWQNNSDVQLFHQQPMIYFITPIHLVGLSLNTSKLFILITSFIYTHWSWIPTVLRPSSDSLSDLMVSCLVYIMLGFSGQ